MNAPVLSPLSPAGLLLGVQYLTPADLAWTIKVSDRTVSEWNCCRRDGPQIPYFKKGRVIRYDPANVQRFIITNTILCPSHQVLPISGTPRLEPEQFEILGQRMERLLQISLIQPALALAQSRKEVAA